MNGSSRFKAGGQTKTIAMQAIFDIDGSKRTPKYLQIVHSVTKAIKQGHYKKGDRILSINELSNGHFLSRDTVQKAYDLLEKEKIIQSIRGKGFYISRTDIARPYRILLLFNKISNYKKVIYNSFAEAFGKKATIDLKIYHSNVRLFAAIVEENLGEYDYYVVMPHFYENIEEAHRVIKEIPADKLFVLDKDLSSYQPEYSAVYQDFKKDIYEALESGFKVLRKYKQLTLVFPKYPLYPNEIACGFRSFCIENRFQYRIISEVRTGDAIEEKEAFVVIEESDLINLIKNCQARKLKLASDVGILSYNDTPLKEIIAGGISVISTDHAQMGQSAARIILSNQKEKIKNPFHLILRNSL